MESPSFPMCESTWKRLRRSAPLLQHRQERQVSAAQIVVRPLLEDIADGPREAACGVVEAVDHLSVRPQLQNQAVLGQQNIVPADRNELHKRVHDRDFTYITSNNETIQKCVTWNKSSLKLNIKKYCFMFYLC